MKDFPNDYVADACPDPSDVARSYCGAFFAYKKAPNIHAAHILRSLFICLFTPFLFAFS